jgi:hypothetical protein
LKLVKYLQLQGGGREVRSRRGQDWQDRGSVGTEGGADQNGGMLTGVETDTREAGTGEAVENRGKGGKRKEGGQTEEGHAQEAAGKC